MVLLETLSEYVKSVEQSTHMRVVDMRLNQWLQGFLYVP